MANLVAFTHRSHFLVGSQQHIKFPIPGQPVLTNSIRVLLENTAVDLDAEWTARGFASLMRPDWADRSTPQDSKWLKDRLIKTVQAIKLRNPRVFSTVRLDPQCGLNLDGLHLSKRTSNSLRECRDNSTADALTLGHIVSLMGAGSVCEFLAAIDRSVAGSAWLEEKRTEGEGVTMDAPAYAADASAELRTLLKSVTTSTDDADLLWNRFVYSTSRAPTLEKVGRMRAGGPVTKARAQQIEKAAESRIRAMKVSLPHISALLESLTNENTSISSASQTELVARFWRGDPFPSAQSLLDILVLVFPIAAGGWEVVRQRDGEVLVHTDRQEEARIVREIFDNLATASAGIVDADGLREQLRTLGKVVNDSVIETVVNGEQLVWLDQTHRWVARAVRGQPKGTALTACRKMLSVCDSATISELLDGFRRDISRGHREMPLEGIIALLAGLDEFTIEGDVVRAPDLTWRQELEGVEFEIVAELFRNGGRASGRALMEAICHDGSVNENTFKAFLYWSPCVVQEARGQHALIGIRDGTGRRL